MFVTDNIQAFNSGSRESRQASVLTPLSEQESLLLEGIADRAAAGAVRIESPEEHALLLKVFSVAGEWFSSPNGSSYGEMKSRRDRGGWIPLGGGWEVAHGQLRKGDRRLRVKLLALPGRGADFGPSYYTRSDKTICFLVAEETDEFSHELAALIATSKVRM